MLVVALTQMRGVGATALISQAAGRKDQPHAELAFNQSFVMSILVGLALGTCAFGLMSWYCNAFTPDSLTASLAKNYLLWFIPALVLQFPLISMCSALRPHMKIWWAMLRIGLPAGAEFVLLFVYITLVYRIIVGFGPAAQAGFGLGVRVMQALFLPVVALSFAVSPVVGQNFGARQADRVRHSVKSGLGIAASMMLVLALITWAAPG